MKSLKTFFGQVLRKNDVDFESQSVRDISVQTHIDFSDAKGGVIEGLDVYKSIDGLSVYITPGVFYTKGSFNSRNSQGGGERGQVYVQQQLGSLPSTAPFGLTPSYLAVYAKTTSVNFNPNPTTSQAIVKSRNLQTGESVPVREFTAGVITVSNPITLDQINGIDGIILALLQVDYFGINKQSSNGTVQVINSSYKQGYVLGGSVDILNNRLVDSGVPNEFITSRMIATGSIVTGKFADGAITSSKIAQWDGSSTSVTEGSGVATEHLKDQAITGPKMNVTGSMSGFSTINYVGNSSFEKDANNLSDWSIYNPSNSGTATVSSSASYFGSNSALLKGFLNQSTQTAQPIGISQNINLTGNQVNNRNVCAFFYLKTSADFPLSISGTTGIFGSVEFLSQGITVGTPQTFASYSGVATDWIKMQTETPLSYSGTSEIDGLKLSISGSFVNVNAYVDGVYLGLTNLIPSWSPSQADSAIGDTLSIANINTSNLTAVNASIVNASATTLTSQQIEPQTSGVSTIGSVGNPFKSVYTDSLYIGGQQLNLGQNIAIFDNSSGFNVPLGVVAMTAELIGGGGGGAGGIDLYGGGAGEYVKSQISVIPGASLTIVVGGGGDAGDSGAGSNASPGDASYILSSTNSVLAQADGGLGGALSSPGIGGGNNAITTTSVSVQGDPGIAFSGASAKISFFRGFGGWDRLANFYEANASGKGSGGGSANPVGGTGAPGLVILTW